MIGAGFWIRQGLASAVIVSDAWGRLLTGSLYMGRRK
jgi:hypothetical protein